VDCTHAFILADLCEAAYALASCIFPKRALYIANHTSAAAWIGRDEFRRMVHRPLRLLRRLRPLYAPSLTSGYSHAMFSSALGRRGSLVFSPALLTGEGVTSL
jgi:hypothetical protein